MIEAVDITKSLDATYSPRLRDRFFGPGEYDPGDMRGLSVPGDLPVYSFGRLEDIDGHMAMLWREFSGKPLICFLHAGLIVHLRRGLHSSMNLDRFSRLWRDFPEVLIGALDSRWLISACDTIADHASDPVERAAAVAGSLFMNTIKLYETERQAQGWPGGAYDVKRGRVPLFDGQSAFAIGRGDMIKNLLQRCDAALPASTAGVICRELIRRAAAHDTVFDRFRAVHDHDKTRW